MNERNLTFVYCVACSTAMVCMTLQTLPLRADESIAVSGSIEASALESTYREDPTAWSFFAAVAIPELSEMPVSESSDSLIDVILTPEVFEFARADLADLRMFDAQGMVVPYRLRTLSKKSIQDPLPSSEFNRSEPVGGAQEVTLEIPSPPSNLLQHGNHNETRIETTGKDFRRSFTVSGSDDGEKWKLIASGNLVRFKEAGNVYQRDSMIYPDSRLRLVRVVVEPDHSIKDEFRITKATLMRHLDLPGEMVTTPATVQAREPGRVNGVPGSTWIIELGGKNIPCHQLEVDVADSEFVRDVQLEQELPARFGPTKVFSSVYLTGENIWQRRLDDQLQPMTISFNEIAATRLRLKVSDHRNKPLTLTAARTTAAARQLVFSRPQAEQLPLKLYFGNPDAEFPNYDFARNLPEVPSAPIVRATLASSERNPTFTPPPKALTERLPWLIYVVLSFVGVVLATVITSLSRSAIAVHDASQ